MGWHVARLLAERGRRVRVLVREAARLRDLPDVEVYSGDLRDTASVARAVAGCESVFHVAADYRLWVKDPAEMFCTNVEGTRNVLEAARRAGVERVVYTSTVGCIGFPKDRPGDERTPVEASDLCGPYKRSKYQAEQVALEYARAGLPVVIVNPTAPVGDHDFKPTPTGKIILDFLRGNLPAFVNTGLNLVDVRDVALGHLLAEEKGCPGERYILGAENLTLKQILQKLSSLSGLTAPRVKIPYFVAYAFGFASTAWAGITGRTPRAPLDGVRMSRKRMFASHARAARELDYQPGPVDEALKRAINWFRENGYC